MPALFRKKSSCLFFVFSVVFLFNFVAFAQDTEGLSSVPAIVFEPERARGEIHGDQLHLLNDYIAIIVNASDENTARFAVETTGGDPDRIGDENSPLIYRIPGQLPWTSYVTVRIDGDDFIFGGEATERAGFGGRTGEMVIAPRIVDDRMIEAAYQIGPIRVTQTLSIIRSLTTGLLDTARIEYRVENTGDEVHRVGLRFMIDTMIGANDGAPFRVEELAILTDHAFFGSQIPPFWQAFDSLSDPKVTSQGTLTGPDVTAPDRVYFTNWGVLANGLWEFDFQENRNFISPGDFVLDSAMALYWDPANLEPGESRSYVTHYGLGGISLSPGQLSLGVTSPANVTADQSGTAEFPVIAYIQNTGEGEARNARATINLPSGLQLVPGEQVIRPLGDLPPGRTSQVTWRVRPDDSYLGGELTYSVRVDATNAETNEVSRSIRVVSPAQLAIEIVDRDGRLRVEDGVLTPVPYPVRAIVRNVGGTDAGGVWVKWDSPIGLQLSAGDRAEKPIGPLMSGEETEVAWHIVPGYPPFAGNLAYAVHGELIAGAASTRASGFLDVPPLEATVALVYSGPEQLRVGDLFTVDVVARHIRDFYGAKVTVGFDGNLTRLAGGAIGVDRGRLFSNLPPNQTNWERPVLTRDGDRHSITFGGDRSPAQVQALQWANDTIATLHFMARQEGTVVFNIEDVSVDRLRIVEGEAQFHEIRVERVPLTIDVVGR